jgi:hypothetical protein
MHDNFHDDRRPVPAHGEQRLAQWISHRLRAHAQRKRLWKCLRKSVALMIWVVMCSVLWAVSQYASGLWSCCIHSGDVHL